MFKCHIWSQCSKRERCIYLEWLLIQYLGAAGPEATVSSEEVPAVMSLSCITVKSISWVSFSSVLCAAILCLIFLKMKIVIPITIESPLGMLIDNVMTSSSSLGVVDVGGGAVVVVVLGCTVLSFVEVCRVDVDVTGPIEEVCETVDQLVELLWAELLVLGMSHIITILGHTSLQLKGLPLITCVLAWL